MLKRVCGFISKVIGNKQGKEYEIILKQYRNKNEKLKRINDSLKLQVSDLSNKLSKAESDLRDSKKICSDQVLSLERINSQVVHDEKLVIEIEKLHQKITNIDVAFGKYLQLFESISRCDSLQELIKNRMGIGDLSNLTINDKLHIVNFIGMDFYLARQIYASMEKYKKQNTSFVTPEERIMIKKVNDYYRSRENNPCDFDVLDLLISETNEKCEFKRKSMKDMVDVGKSDFIYVKGVYVPALRTERDNGFERKAIVKGD